MFRKAPADGTASHRADAASRRCWHSRSLAAFAVFACIAAGGASAQEADGVAAASMRLDPGGGPVVEAVAKAAHVRQPHAEPAFAGAVLSIGALAFGGTMTGLLILALRARAGRRRLHAGEEHLESPPMPDSAQPAEQNDDGLVSVAMDDLAKAARSADIRRILVVASSAPEFLEAAFLARQMTRSGLSTILIDFAYSHAAREMGIVGRVEDVVTTAASPTSFAHGINRDRASRAHFLPVEIGPIDGDRNRIRDATAAVLATLAEAYDMTVAVLSSCDADCLDAVSDKNTAIVVPSRAGHPSATAQVLDDLARHGIQDVVVMVETGAERLRAA